MTQQYCYGHIRGQKLGQRIGIIKYLDSGYYPSSADIGQDHDADSVDVHIDQLNTRLGVSREVRDAMEAGSMFGWRVPAAVEALKYFGTPEIEKTA